MRVCIHRGTQEVGGTCIEIQCQGSRIVLDTGLPLNADDSVCHLPQVKGFREPDKTLLSVVISHTHQDHYGLAIHNHLFLTLLHQNNNILINQKVARAHSIGFLA